MYLFAAALPFTSRAGLFFRAVALREVDLRRLVGAFFVTRLRRRAGKAGLALRVAARAAGLRSSDWTAIVCCENPANPPGGTIMMGILSPQKARRFRSKAKFGFVWLRCQLRIRI